MKPAIWLLVGLCGWLPLPARAIMTIEWTESNVTAALGWNGFQWLQHGQTFTLTDAMYLLTAEFQISAGFGEPELFTATLRDGNNLSQVLASVNGFTSSATHSGWESFNFDSVALGPGNYAITVARTETFPAGTDSFRYDTSGNAPGHHITWSNGEWSGGGLADSAFSFTFGAIPEPRSLGLILAGGLLLFAWKRKLGSLRHS